MWMNIQEIAQRAGVSQPVVRAAIETRELNAVTTHPDNPGHWMAHQKEVDRWIGTLPGSGQR
jgi:hypothetical protein